MTVPQQIDMVALDRLDLLFDQGAQGFEAAVHIADGKAPPGERLRKAGGDGGEFFLHLTSPDVTRQQELQHFVAPTHHRPVFDAFPAANRALIQLQDLGILESVKEQKRNRVFVARKVIDVLDRPTIPEVF